MQDFLERIQLIVHKQIKLNIDKSEFIRKFQQNVDQGNIGAFSGAFEAFSSSQNRYKGNITQNEFEMRRKREFFDRSSYLARVTGSFRQQNDQLVIDAKITGFNNFLIIFYVFVTLFYIFFIYMFTSGFNDSGIPAIFIFIHALFMYGIPYFMIRKRVKNTAGDLEKELFFMTKKES